MTTKDKKRSKRTMFNVESGSEFFVVGVSNVIERLILQRNVIAESLELSFTVLKAFLGLRLLTSSLMSIVRQRNRKTSLN